MFLIRSIVSSLVLISSVFLFSCTATSYLNEGQHFYDGANINFKTQGKIKEKKALKGTLEELLSPDPNTKILGMRPGVWIYYAMGTPKKKNGLRGWIKQKVGEEPVLMRDVTPDRTATILEGNLFNKGYFESRVKFDIREKNKKGHVDYEIDLFPAFVVREIEYPNDPTIAPFVEEIKKESILRIDNRYDLQEMKAELARIEVLMENKGYYYFDDRYLLFEADTTIGNRGVNLTLTMIPNIPVKVKRKYKIENINVINDYFLRHDSVKTNSEVVEVDNYRYSHTEDTFRPSVITDVINLEKDSLYKRDDHNFTISHLMGLGTFKFVNIKYKEAPDSSKSLITDIFLTPLHKKSIRMEAQGTTKTNNFVGPGLGITFTNRNFLRGAERFELKLDGSYEWQISNKQSTAVNAISLSVNASLSVPRLLLPFNIYNYSRKYLPHTKFGVGVDFQQRINYFQMNSFNISYGYQWRETTTKSHEFFPVEINYVKVSKITPEFEEILNDNPTLKNSFQDQFIPGMRYSFTLNTQLKEGETASFGEKKIATSNFYFRGNVSLSGNLTDLIVTKTASSGEQPPYKIFGLPYSQFVMGDVDFRYFWQLDRRNRLVSRIALGAGYPYGNSTTLPYIKQFASGGSSSIRAFPARSIGPGTYNVYDDPNYNDAYYVDQRGDIKVEGNVEYRYDIFKMVKGALFVDAGNIWLWNKDDNDNREGVKFDADTFLKELAVGTGLGIRFDFNFFILRFDLAFPIRKPWLQDGERWVFDEIDFGSKTWRKDNLVLNIAIGYPF